MTSRIFLYTAILAIIIGGWYAWTEYNRTDTNSETVEVEDTLEAATLMGLFHTDEQATHRKYAGKYIAVIGLVAEIVDSGIIILSAGDNGIIKCSLSNATAASTVSTGDHIVATGLLAGYISLGESDFGTDFGDLGTEPDEIGMRNVSISKAKLK